MQIAHNEWFAFFVLDNLLCLLKTFYVKIFAYIINMYYLCSRFRVVNEAD